MYRLNIKLFSGKINFISILFLILFLGLSLFLRTLNLNKGISGDEGILSDIAKLDLNQMFEVIKQIDVYPPVSHILVHHWMFFSQSEVWIRMYFVLFGMGVCVLIYLIGKEYINERFGILALAISAFSPLLIFTSQFIRSYGDSAFWMLLSTFYLLKIIKGKDSGIVWAFYLLSIIVSLYTFYFSVFIIFAQFLLLIIFKRRERKVLLRSIFVYFLAGLAFLPWLPIAVKQLTCTPIFNNWANKGFHVARLPLGIWTRNIFSLFGFDPYFMIFQGGIIKHFSKSLLMGMVILTVIGLIFFMYYILKYLKKLFPRDKTLMWFFIFLIFIPLVLSWVCGEILNFRLNAKYLVILHIFFIVLVSVFVYGLWLNKSTRALLALIAILGIFVYRIPMALLPVYDVKEAIAFLRENLKKEDCILCTVPYLTKELNGAVLRLDTYVRLDESRSNYIFKSEQAKKDIQNKIKSFDRIWFYRIAGNFEVFGANRLFDEWLKSEGYSISKRAAFRNIDIIEYGK